MRTVIAAVDNNQGTVEHAATVSRSRRAACRDAARLLELARLMDRTADLEGRWPRVAEGVASLLDARGCAIVFCDIESGGMRRYGSRDAVVPAGDACALATASVSIGNDAIGMIQVVDAPDALPFDAEHLAALRLVAQMVGQAVHRARMHKLLHSRFAQVALLQSPDASRGAALRDAVAQREGIGRLVARSLYREMVNAGFEASDIVCSASELISQLSAGLRRTRRAQPPDMLPAGHASAAPDERRAA